MPIFTAYVASNILQGAVLLAAFSHYEFRSRPSIVIGWLSQCAPQLLRVFATIEIIRRVLRPFRGIWGLAWRVLAVAFVGVFSFALIDSRQNLQWAIEVADLGFHLAFGVALVACLLLIHYYSVPVHPVYKALLVGFCFYSCTVVLANTIGKFLYLRGISDFETGWQLMTIGAFVAVLVIWGVALREPLPEPGPEAEPEMAESIYWELSPGINERLRLLNERLYRLWKPEATRN
ncbi:MAG TPA: hypothetical protein VE263_19255 [Candidatus Angelobacter sp.]|nr:hypothetical protein [Candidatus Angelobacter sp.]